MIAFFFLLAAVILVVGIWYAARLRVGRSRLEVQETGDHFPAVSGYNLQREEYQFPEDFTGRWNLLIVPFKREQQRDVNTWVPALQRLEQEFPGFIYYELPTIYSLPALSRTFINEGMRAGIPDQTARERTITLYLDKDRFKEAVGIDSEQVIHLLLVDQKGQILWRAQGAFLEEILDELEEALKVFQA